MYQDEDKKNYKITYVELYKRNLNEMELIAVTTRLLTFINKINLYPFYKEWSRDLKKSLNDEDIRLSMMEERDE